MLILNFIHQVRIQNLRLAILSVFKGIKGNLNDVISSHTLLFQMIAEQPEQEIGFTASAKTCEHFDKAVLHF